MNKDLMRKYAKLAVCTGVNIQPGQLLVINAQVKDYEFVKMCAEEAYKVNAAKVLINWSYEDLNKLDYENCSMEVLCEIPDYAFDMRKYQQDNGAAFLSVSSGTPGLLKDIDPEKLRNSQMASMKKFAPLRDYTMANHGQWSIVALPNAGWAKRVFPDDEPETAFQKLEDAILMSVRINEENDPVEEWKNHNAELRNHVDVLNEYHFDRLHFVSENGTDLYVGLVKKHLWAGGSCISTKGVEFEPNMPTEEVFSMPDKYNVNGKVVASKPLSLQGKLVENFWIEFKDGKAVNYGAEKEAEALKTLLELDEGSSRLGEVALISYDSPISKSNILFYNTLFDENASCHLALGDSYPENIENGVELTDEEKEANHSNSSMTHVDFMFGTKDMSVVGIREDGSEVEIFRDGNFVI